MEHLQAIEEVKKKLMVDTLKRVGFNSMKASVLEEFSSALDDYVHRLLYNTMNNAQLANRSKPNLFDVARGMDQSGARTATFRRYLTRLNIPRAPRRQPLVAYTAPEIPRTTEEVNGLPSDEETEVFEPVPTPNSITPNVIPTVTPPKQVAPTLPSYVPPHLPKFPPKHSFKQTPIYLHRSTDPRTIRHLNAQQSRLVEENLKRFMAEEQQTLEEGSATTTTTSTGTSMPFKFNPRNAVMINYETAKQRRRRRHMKRPLEGMVGYPESITDPSYRGQILVLTFPLIGNYGVPSREDMDELLKDIPKYFESSEIHVAGLIVGQYTEEYSHYLAQSSLSKWLKEYDVPALYGIDTRALTKKIRTEGVLLGKILFPKAEAINGETLDENWIQLYQDVDWCDPNERNLVAEVSHKEPKLYSPAPEKVVKNAKTGKTLRILALDVGMKFNQIRCFVNRGVELLCLPWNYDFTTMKPEEYDGIFISNGPGDPTTVEVTITRLRTVLARADKPIFGICLGHQLLALASGAKTTKLKYGNRGHNIPCTDMLSGRCYITSQNHGYAVDASTLSSDFQELFVNANDGTNEGIIHKTLPYFSVQFHPESTPGPRDTEYLFDIFINTVQRCAESGRMLPVEMPEGKLEGNVRANPRVHVNKVLILGSGGLSIGQAGEFDYSGSQAIKALKEEGIYTILINPNIATIQTSKGLADKVYFLPVTPDFVRKVIKHEKPDGIYVTFGGQTALNVGIKLKDEFESLGVKVLGTQIDTIIKTEDRDLFAQALEEINEKCAQSASATSVAEALEAANTIGYPVICRAAYALGGLGSGFAENDGQLASLCQKAFAASPQVLIERSMKGWKEIEYEVVRDCRDNCITVCNMENFDPLGIHTGDSIVIAPSQTLSDEDYNMLRTTAVNVIRHLGVVGECNIQYALNPFSKEYCIIEVNARLSRSSALASKATGYPLAFVAAKLGLGIPLNEISNSVTKVTCACFEPSLDYVVVKIPRWDLKKFTRVSTALSSSMKSVGEVMAIGRTFEETIQKAIRAIDYHLPGFSKNDMVAVEDIDYELKNPSDKRLFAIANAFHLGYTVDQIWKMTCIDKWFLNKLRNIHVLEKSLTQYSAADIPGYVVRAAKQLGFSDRQVATGIHSNELAARRLRQEYGITPFVKQIDTVAAEFPAYTNYLYMTYNAVEHDIQFGDHGVMVLGSGVYRIGSSVEFDWCAVRAIRTLRDRGIKTIMVNYNPETVSTDYDEADRLYFENISLERVLDIYEIERSGGVIMSMGGQTPNNIALPLHRQNVKVFGTSPEMIDTAENRYKFSRMCDKIGVDQPLWKELTSYEDAKSFCDKVGYPVLVRPSYVLSGAAMNVVFSAADLKNYLSEAAAVSRDHPVVITKYIEEAKEIEMDAVAVDGKMVMHVISEHVENAGVHSGDATLVLPPQDLDPETVRKIEEATAKIGNALNVTGPYNIQFMAKNNEIKVIECNVRAARSFPFVSKVMGIDLIEMATNAMLGLPVEFYPKVDIPKQYVGIKVPQFSFSRLSGADPILGVEMASTGEVACFGKDKYEAYMKSLLATGFQIPQKNVLLSIGSFKEKQEMLPSVQKLHDLGYNLFATSGTADFIQEHGIPVKYLDILDGDDNMKAEFSLQQHLANNLIDLYINLPSRNKYRRPASYMSKGYKTRRMAVDYSVPLITNVKIAKLFVEALARYRDFEISSVDYKTSHTSVILPGLVNVEAFVPNLLGEQSNDFEAVSKASLTGGFTTISVAPNGVDAAIEDLRTMNLAHGNANGKAYIDYTLAVAASTDNASRLGAVSTQAAALFVAFDKYKNGGLTKVSAVDAHFSSWAQNSPLITDAKGTDLASMLLLASLHSRSLHVTNVTTRDDIGLITMSKDKGLNVTCDVSVYSLFLDAETYASKHLPTKADQAALWDNLSYIDCFSVGSMPYALAQELGRDISADAGIYEALPLLLTAQVEGRLTLDDIREKLSINPRKILGLPEQPDTYVEIEIGRRSVLTPGASKWSPFQGKEVHGNVHRVVVRGKTLYLDGTIFGTSADGINASSQVAPLTTSSSLKTDRDSSAMQPLSPIIPTRRGSKLPPLDTSLAEARSLDEKRAVTPIIGRTEMPLVSAAVSKIISRSPFYRKHILTSRQFDRNDLHMLFGIAHEMRNLVERYGTIDLMQGRVMTTMFFEASTRTSSSFEAAMLRLGGKVVSVDATTSSVQKGETLADTVRTLGCYGDLIVLRHPQPGSPQLAAKYSKVPIINAGDGVGEHPTQAFLDVYTIREELGTVNGLTITLVGDLKNGRTVHSLVKILAYYHVTLNYVSPPSLRMPDDVKAEVRRAGVEQNEYDNLDQVIGNTDVLYVTRVQKERFDDLIEYERVKDAFIVNNSVLSKAKSQMIVMHPLPRVNEIDPEVDFDQRAAYFRQMRYGLYVRMALLALVLGTMN
ncbi:Protein pyrABCN [Bifiguratus adelaidae]|uniref:Pyrimidine-specific carbamoyl phosphate synthase-aspartate carbamoyl transferase n=1 Tax=Bifiguratus adelaidae TaxID=1938954 RepID=A0A261XW27_9FUNG|nr:Protein pyrABCN [Bifiguratus adelaidae]